MTQYRKRSSSESIKPLCQHSQRSPHLLVLWWKEALAASGSTITMAAFMVFLWTYDGRPVSSWPYSSLFTLNSTVTAFSTAIRGLFMFSVSSMVSHNMWLWVSRPRPTRLRDLDDFNKASTGAWGSLVLLRRIIFQPDIAWLGLVTTVLALAFETFNQQLLSTRPGTSTDLGPDNYVPRASQYTNGNGNTGYITMGSTGTSFVPPTDPTAQMLSAFYAGSLGSSAPNITATCSSANCTWPVIPTLGACGSCSATTTYPNSSSMYTGYNITTPSGSVTEIPFTMSGTFFSISTSSVPVQNGIALFDILNMPAGLQKSEFSTSFATAARCLLEVCVQAYEVSVTNGSTSERLVSTWTGLDATASNGTFQGPVFGDIPAEMNASPADTYTLDYRVLEGFKSDIASLLNGTGSLNAAVDQNWEFHWSSPEVEVIQSATTTADNITSWIGNFAAQISYVLRTNSATGPSAEDQGTYAGTASTVETLYAVRWAWAIPSCLTVVLSAAYVSLGLLQTARAGVPVRKGNILTVLFLKLDPLLLDSVSVPAMAAGSIAEELGEVTVGLDRSDEGKLRMVKQDCP